jgi:hypothetical protein
LSCFLGFVAWFNFLAVGRKPSGVSPHIPGKTGRLAPFRYGLLPGFVINLNFWGLRFLTRGS